MSQSTENTSEIRPESDQLSDDLPPVQPPSAGFIVQLFVVPGLIVLAVVAVWVLFGRIATGDQNWEVFVEELQSPNEHIRKRAMYGLAQLLDQDRRRGEAGKHLASNPKVAKELSDLLSKELRTASKLEESLAFQNFLTRTVGLLDLPSVTFPVLRQAMEPTQDLEIRKSGILSVALTANRALEAGTPINDEQTVQTLIELSTENNNVIRHTATFALGLVPCEASDQQLHVLMGHSDWLTTVNAAVALTRQQNTDGLAIFKQALTIKMPDKPELLPEYMTVLTNSMTAIAKIAPKMNESDKKEFRELLEKIVADHSYVRVRVDAQNAVNALK